MGDGLRKGWKDIARHIGVHEDTAVRYAKELGMPVRKIGARAVVALKEELESWIKKMETLNS